MPARTVFGYIFIAREEDWTGLEQDFVVGNREPWNRVAGSDVRIGRPVLILLCASKPRLAGTAKTIEVPAEATEFRDRAWIEYTARFRAREFPLPPQRGRAPARRFWDNRQIPLILGLESAIEGEPPRPCGVPAKTSRGVSVDDALRIAAIFPGLPWGPGT